MTVEELIARFGYVALFVGVALEGEMVLVAAGALAHRGDLSLPIVIVLAFASSVAADQGWFHLGRRYGSAFVERHPRIRASSAFVERWLARRGALFVLGFRFLYGLRTATPILLGVARYPVRKFTALNAAGAALWAITFATLGYTLGATIAVVMKRAGRIEEFLFAGLCVAAIVALIVSRRRRESRSRTPLAVSHPRL